MAEPLRPFSDGPLCLLKIISAFSFNHFANTTSRIRNIIAHPLSGPRLLSKNKTGLMVFFQASAWILCLGIKAHSAENRRSAVFPFV